MPQREYVPLRYQTVSSKETADDPQALLHLRTVVQDVAQEHDVPFDFTFSAVRPNIFHLRFSSRTHPLPPHPSICRPNTDLHGVKVSVSQPSETRKSLQIGDVLARIDYAEAPVISLSLASSTSNTDEARVLHADLPHRSYALDGPGIAHYTTHDREALHVGLGEASAPFDLTGRGFKVDATDCFGYDVYNTSPMYKHMPFLLKATPHGCVGIVNTSHSRAFWSLGSEIDGLWGRFKVYRQDYGGLEQYIIVGRTMKDVIRSYAELVGFPLLVPKWAYGYLSGGYRYCMEDSPPAHVQLCDFVRRLEEHDIPCSAHQMSSGYSIAEVEPKVRNVFTWNKHRFPDPEAWIQEMHRRGIRLLTNIKPFVLRSHPDYAYLEARRGLFSDPKQQSNGKGDLATAETRLWSAGGGESGFGGHVDFTCESAYEWWRNGVRRLKQQGIDAMWNDNNEYTIPDDSWLLKLDRKMDDLSNGQQAKNGSADKSVGMWGRAMQTELMGQASYEGLLDAEPGVRPFVLTRSASIGTLRYCSSSWSGDNMTSWEGMKGANALSLTAGVSLMHCYGHDIGGFEGPQPSPELLLRWIQLGIYGPRFAINCFKTSPKDNAVGEVIEPWMYPEITPLVRDAIKRRYEILPYIYSLGLQSHLEASPPQRWIGMGHESDPEVWTKKLQRGEEQFWFGESLLVGGIYEPGEHQAKMYLPRKTGEQFDLGYVNLNAPYQYLAAGQWVNIESRWKESIPVLAKVGGAIQVGKSVQTRMSGDLHPSCKTLPEDDYRGIEIFPPQRSSHGIRFTNDWFEDDGMSLHPEISTYTVQYSSTEEKVVVGLAAGAHNIFVPPWKDVTIILPCGDERHVVSVRGDPVEQLDRDSKGRVRYRMAAPIPRKEEVVNGLTNGFH